MENFNLFMTLVLSNISTFLTSEPIIWFVGLVLLAFIVKILSLVVHASCRF